MTTPTSAQTEVWCGCDQAPVLATGALTILDHPGRCGFPIQRCEEDGHRLVRHEECGRPVAMRFCGCGKATSGFTFDRERGWWVHYQCGWPTRAWYEGSGRPAPPQLLGIKPITYHEFVAVPRAPKATYLRLTAEQKVINDEFAGRWIWD